jgi:hypothetical protein
MSWHFVNTAVFVVAADQLHKTGSGNIVGRYLPNNFGLTTAGFDFGIYLINLFTDILGQDSVDFDVAAGHIRRRQSQGGVATQQGTND